MADHREHHHAEPLVHHRGNECQMQGMASLVPVRIAQRISGPWSVYLLCADWRKNVDTTAASWMPGNNPGADGSSSGQTRPSGSAAEPPPSTQAAPDGADRQSGSVDAAGSTGQPGAGPGDPLRFGLV